MPQTAGQSQKRQLKERTAAESELLKAELQRALTEFRSTHAVSHALVSSRSWRATTPLRLVSQYAVACASKLFRRNPEGLSLRFDFSQPMQFGTDYELIRQARLIIHSGLFDADWYSHQYPDVLASATHPALHYCVTRSGREKSGTSLRCALVYTCQSGCRRGQGESAPPLLNLRHIRGSRDPLE